MTNDCLRFKPTVATTCYGMNDHRYGPYTQEIGDTYRTSSETILKAFKAHGARAIQGSPGCVGLKNMTNWDAAGSDQKSAFRFELLCKSGDPCQKARGSAAFKLDRN
jgi:hypothetical protein